MSGEQTTRRAVEPWQPARRPITIGVGAAVLVSACIVGFVTDRAGAVEPTTVTCGQVLTESTLIANDSANCPEHGLVIGASGIEVDLAGRTLDRVGLGAGILNEGFDEMTISGGTLQEFDLGIRVACWSARRCAFTRPPPTPGEPFRRGGSRGRGAREWNVTNQVSTMLATGVNNGFLIRDAVDGARGGFEQSFAARELRNRPQLILRLDDD